jgi:hypothetical protein
MDRFDRGQVQVVSCSASGRAAGGRPHRRRQQEHDGLIIFFEVELEPDADLRRRILNGPR